MPADPKPPPLVVYRRHVRLWVGERDGDLAHAVARFRPWRLSHLWLLARQRGRVETRW